MKESFLGGEPFVESVFHPSDFSRISERAFAHALAISLRGKTRFTILNVGQNSRRERWLHFPSVRTTLERWGLLEEGSHRSAIFRELKVRLKKVSLRKRRPLTAVLNYLDEHPTDLIVVATEAREGFPRWLRPSLAEAIARESRTMTLFVPEATRGFVSRDEGGVTLQRILVPIDHYPNPRPAIVYAARAAAMSESPPVEIVLFHVVDSDRIPRVTPPDDPNCSWSNRQATGDVVEEIIRAAEEPPADLIVMATEGHDGILDALRGSVTEQVLRRAPCPVLAVPKRLLFP